MTIMEPRVAERRKSVSEDRARKRLKWILLVIVAVGIVIGTIWLIRSPVLSIRQVEISGADRSDPMTAVDGLAMSIGTPTIDADAAAITDAIVVDPWVESVVVDIRWPGSILIEVIERTPVAPVLAGDRWVLVGRDGGVIMAIDDPTVHSVLVAIDLGEVALGDMITDPSVAGALEFIAHLSADQRRRTVVASERGGLVADVGGHKVRLGRPVDMAQKASVLDALLDAGIQDGAAIDLIAPLRPAVTNPQPQVEPEA